MFLITVLAGGTGSVKLVRGLAAAAAKQDMTVISNVGDNIWLHGLYVCPDIDTIIYGLAGLLDTERGWGIKNDTFECLNQLKNLGAESWFSLGDRDLATHIARTEMMEAGKSLSEVTDVFRNHYSIRAEVIPATDDDVQTKITTGKGTMHLQEFWVKHKGAPHVTGIKYDSADRARANDRALKAIRDSDAVVIAPANPVSSIGPIVALAGIRKELERKRKRVVAVSPIIGKSPVSGPAAKYMRAVGLPSSPLGVAQYYQDFAGKFVIDKSDRALTPKIQALGIETFETNIMMEGRPGEVRLAKYLLKEVCN
jgi:LPPG:FO 2-phospho-L-lactate transferase